MASPDEHTSSTQKTYNPIFEKLVISTEPDTKERLIGMLAYADYKEDKYQWKEQYRKTHNVQTVPPEAVEHFLLAYHEDKFRKLLSDAEQTLYVFGETYSEDIVAEAYNDAVESNIVKEVKRYRDGWWISGFKGALGSFFFAVLVFIASLIFSLAKPDSNYSRLFQFIVSNKDFVILPVDDCRLSDEDNC